MISPNSYYLKTVTGSDTPITLYPTWDSSFNKNKTKVFTRAQGGQLNSYLVKGQFDSINLPIMHINSSGAFTINTWWENQTELEFRIAGVEDTYNYFCKVANTNKPFSVFEKGNINLNNGVLYLRTTWDERALIGAVTNNNLYDFGTQCTDVWDLIELDNGRILAGVRHSGGNSPVWYSDDDGDSWTSVDVGGSVTIDDVYCFADLGDGNAVCGTEPTASNYLAYISDDYGGTWVKCTTSFTSIEYFRSMCLLDSGRILGGGSGTNSARMWYSDDGGDTWTQAGAFSTTTDEVQCIIDLGDGVVLCGISGSGSSEGEVHKSEDYGLTWIKVLDPGIEWCPCLVDLNNGVILAGFSQSSSGSASKLYRSVDNGDTWTEISPFDNTWYGIDCFLRLNNGAVLCGLHGYPGPGAIALSMDKGLTWEKAVDVVQSPYPIYSVRCMLYRGNGQKRVIFGTGTSTSAGDVWEVLF